MSTIRYTLVALCMMTGARGTAVAVPLAGYTTTAQLHDGKQVTCAVDEPVAAAAAGAQTQTLTASERNEAEIAATAILRRQAGKQKCLPDSCDGAACAVLMIVPASGVRRMRCGRRERRHMDAGWCPSCNSNLTGGSTRSLAFGVVKRPRGWLSRMRCPRRAVVIGKDISWRAAALSDPVPRRVHFFP
ncbi:hypothetical protein [Paraburkholderia xenovorans]